LVSMKKSAMAAILNPTAIHMIRKPTKMVPPVDSLLWKVAMADMIPLPPDPGIPRAMIHEKMNWQKNTKKKSMKLKLVAEGLVGRPEPAEEGERDEDEAVDQGETKL